jgi:mRNA-degrading endonuclease RelE of RelBE toxin-antitoxin system
MKQSKSIRGQEKEDLSTTSSKKYKIICTDNFMSEARKLAKKFPKIKEDLLVLRDQLKVDPITGNESLGQNLYKVRMQMRDKKKGQSGGARIIIQVKIINKIVYVLSIYDKGDLETKTDKELNKLLKKAGLK